jgi:arsenate reductase
LHAAGARYDWVIIMCDAQGAAQVPPLCPPQGRLRWDLEQPSDFSGTWAERLEATRRVREQIGERLEHWLLELGVKGKTG